MWNPLSTVIQSDQAYLYHWFARICSCYLESTLWSQIIGPDKLPSPWDVGKAFSTLTWSETEQDKR